MQSQLCWTGYVVCMKDHPLPKNLLNGELSQGKCSQGNQKNHFKDTLKVSMKSFGITPNCLEYLAPLAPPFLVMTTQDSSAHILVSLAICARKDAFFNHKVDQMILIDYDVQRRKNINLFDCWKDQKSHSSFST